MRELRLGQPVDRRNDETDPCGRDLDAVVASVFDRDGIHVYPLRAKCNLARADVDIQLRREIAAVQNVRSAVIKDVELPTIPHRR